MSYIDNIRRLRNAGLSFEHARLLSRYWFDARIAARASGKEV